MCRKEGFLLCAEHEKLETIAADRLLPCNVIVKAPLVYKSKEVAKTIEAFKYFGNKQIVSVLSPYLKQIVIDEDTVLVPIPLHWRRQLWRGFNQASLIANKLSQVSDVPVRHLLKRTRYTSQQARLTKEQRRENLKDAFVFIGDDVPQCVTLVDDVAASGATICAAAKVLRAAGVGRVNAICLAQSVGVLDRQEHNY